MQLHFKEYGEGEPLIILHGLFGSLDNWHSLAKEFARDFRVFAVDQRNHGKSPNFDQHDYPSMVEDLRSFIEDQDLDSVSLIGHSMGGKTAMYFAIYYPEKVNKLIVADMGPEEYHSRHQEIIQAMEALPVEGITSRKEADDFLAQYIDDFGIRQFLLKNLEKKRDGSYQWKVNLPVLVRDYSKILAAIPNGSPFHNPTLFLKGGKSGYLRDKDMPTISTMFPSSEIREIEDAGHWIHAEAPEAFYREVVEFLRHRS